MLKHYLDFFKILDYAIQNIEGDLPKGFDVAEGLELAKRHRVVSMYFYGLINCGYKRVDPFMQNAFADVCTEVLIDERQRYELSRIEEVFAQNNIHYMLLKGSLLKNLYHKPEMRSMGDLDILIKMEQYGEIEKQLTLLGFQKDGESDHEILWSNSNCVIELHKHLIPSYNYDYYEYYGNGWHLAQYNDNNKFYMSNEDNLVFLFTHFAKHYRDRGIGIRPILDLRLYSLKYPNLDQEYIMGELKKLKLDKFYINIIKMLNAWFQGAELNSTTQFLTKRIVENYVYGNRRNLVLSKALREQKANKSVFGMRIKRMLRSVFVPYRVMAARFNSVKRCPILLPFMWVYYFFERLFQKQKRKTFIKDVSLLNNKQVKQYQKELNFVGLDYNFEE